MSFEGLAIIPTPIGNLEDITYRSVRYLKEADLILAEDTRQTRKLLKHLDIDTPIKSFHMHNEHKAVAGLIQELKTGINIALVSDAGTPGISDPGFLLVRSCVELDIRVECLPGPTAIIPALVASGLPCDRFIFEGFLPPKKGRKSKIEALAEERKTLVLYEAPHRIVKTLTQLAEFLGENRKAVVAREISKMFEEYHRGTLKELIATFEEKPPKGEIVLVVQGKEK